MKRVLILFAFLLFAAASLHAQVGKQAPEFSLKDSAGKNVALSDYKGKIVVLNFWATWCPPCRKEIPDFIRVYKNYKSKGVEIIGISLDQKGWDVVRPFVKNNNMNYPILLGDMAVAQAYGNIQSIPTTFIIDKKGKIIDSHVGSMTEKELIKKFEKLL